MLLESRMGLSEATGFFLWDHKIELQFCRWVYVSDQQGEK